MGEGGDGEREGLLTRGGGVGGEGRRGQEACTTTVAQGRWKCWS